MQAYSYAAYEHGFDMVDPTQVSLASWLAIYSALLIMHNVATCMHS